MTPRKLSRLRVVCVLGLCTVGPAIAGTSCGPASTDPSRDGSGLEKDTSSATEWPTGTLFAVDGQPVFATDVDGVADAIGELYPSYVEAQRRRLAITNVVLPLWAVRSRDAVARDKTFERCAAIHAAGITNETPNKETLAGGVQILGIDLWVEARTLEVGAWSEPIELIGRWVLIRLDRLEKGELSQGEWLEITLLTFPYIDFSNPEAPVARLSAEEAMDVALLEIVSPTWAEFIPEAFKFRMRGRTQGESNE